MVLSSCYEIILYYLITIWFSYEKACFRVSWIWSMIFFQPPPFCIGLVMYLSKGIGAGSAHLFICFSYYSPGVTCHFSSHHSAVISCISIIFSAVVKVIKTDELVRISDEMEDSPGSTGANALLLFLLLYCTYKMMFLCFCLWFWWSQIWNCRFESFVMTKRS